MNENRGLKTKGEKMKINIKTRKSIDVKEIRTIGWKDIKGLNIIGGNVVVKRI